ncbi:hypothetical protein LTR60_006989, partial [Cryomyces antarcticus]
MAIDTSAEHELATQVEYFSPGLYTTTSATIDSRYLPFHVTPSPIPWPVGDVIGYSF